MVRMGRRSLENPELLLADNRVCKILPPMSPPEIPPPISTHKPLPKWKPRDLAEHAKKRVTVDAGCLESIYGLDHQLVTGDLRRISEQTFLAPCLVYECESLDLGWRFRDRRHHFVDGQIVMAITDRDRQRPCRLPIFAFRSFHP